MQISHIIKKYDEKTVVNDVSFSLPKGKVTSLIGPNGAGKSTLSKCITGENQMTSGELRVKGELIKIPSYNVREYKQME